MFGDAVGCWDVGKGEETCFGLIDKVSNIFSLMCVNVVSLSVVIDNLKQNLRLPIPSRKLQLFARFRLACQYLAVEGW